MQRLHESIASSVSEASRESDVNALTSNPLTCNRTSRRTPSRRSINACASWDDDGPSLHPAMPKDCSDRACFSSDAKNEDDMVVGDGAEISERCLSGRKVRLTLYSHTIDFGFRRESHDSVAKDIKSVVGQRRREEIRRF